MKGGQLQDGEMYQMVRQISGSVMRSWEQAISSVANHCPDGPQAQQTDSRSELCSATTTALEEG
jgi:hypothetical protein